MHWAYTWGYRSQGVNAPYCLDGSNLVSYYLQSSVTVDLLSCSVIWSWCVGPPSFLAPYHSWHYLYGCFIPLDWVLVSPCTFISSLTLAAYGSKTRGLHLSVSSPSSSSLGSVLDTCVGREEERIKVVGQPLFPNTHPFFKLLSSSEIFLYTMMSRLPSSFLEIQNDMTTHSWRCIRTHTGYVRMMNTINITYMRSWILGWLSNIMWV